MPRTQQKFRCAGCGTCRGRTTRSGRTGRRRPRGRGGAAGPRPVGRRLHRRVEQFWLSVLSELKSRSVADVCIPVLTGLPHAVEVTWPQAVVQACVVYQIRASLRYASKRDWTPVTKDLRPIYTANDERAAAPALAAFAERWQTRYRDRAAVAGGLRAVHPVPSVPARGPAGDLHDQPDREHERPAADGHPQPRPVPVRAGRAQGCSTSRSATSMNTAHPASEPEAPGGNKPCMRSPSSSRGGSPPHDRHRRLHRSRVLHTPFHPRSGQLDGQVRGSATHGVCDRASQAGPRVARSTRWAQLGRRDRSRRSLARTSAPRRTRWPRPKRLSRNS